MVTKTRVTVQDLWRLGEGDSRRELVNGEVVEMAPVAGIHGQVTGRMYRCLEEYVRRHGSGEVLVGDVGFILNLPADPEMGDVGALLTLLPIANFRLPMANCLKTKEQDHGLLTADYGTTSLPIADWRLQM